MSIVDQLLENAYNDTELLTSNDAKGDQFDILRDVEFILIASEKTKAETVASFIDDNRYGEAVVSQNDERFVIKVTLNIMPATQPLICSVSGLVVCIAQLFGVHYNGWGCILQK